jgi:hypothetical protein
MELVQMTAWQEGRKEGEEEEKGGGEGGEEAKAQNDIETRL